MAYPLYFPVYLSLQGRKCLVVGGGAIAEEKVGPLVAAGAVVTVVAPALSMRLGEMVRAGAIHWIDREYTQGDADGMFLAVGATNDQAVNRSVSSAAIAANRLGNSVDDPDACNFIMASIAKAGPVQVAVSTAGCSPALGQRIRDRIAEEMLGEDVGTLAEFLGSKRAEVKQRLQGYRTRQRFWEGVLGSGIPGLLAAGDGEQAEAEFERMLATFN